MRFERGNRDSFLWDDADALIEQTDSARSFRIPKSRSGKGHVDWPRHFYWIGGDFALGYVVDLRQSPCRVLEVERLDVTPYEQPSEMSLPFGDWLKRHLDDYRRDGIDLDAEEAPVKTLRKGCAYGGLAIVALVLLAGVVQIGLWIVRLLGG